MVAACAAVLPATMVAKMRFARVFFHFKNPFTGDCSNTMRSSLQKSFYKQKVTNQLKIDEFFEYMFEEKA